MANKVLYSQRMREYCKIRLKHFYPLARTMSFLILGVFCTGNCYALSEDRKSIDLNTVEENLIDGVIGDLDSFSFDLSESNAMLIEVKRVNAEFKLVLSNSQNEFIYAVSFPTRDLLSERILVTSKDCLKCELQILPILKVDQSGKYELFAKSLSNTDDKAQIEFEAKMTAGSIMWFKATEENRQLDVVLETFLEAIEKAKQYGATEAKQRSLYIAAQAAHFNDKFEILKKFAAIVFNSSSDENDVYRLKAVYLLAMLATEEEDYEPALEYFIQVHQLSIFQSDVHFSASANNLLGLIAVEQGRSQEAYELFEKSYQSFVLAGEWRLAIDGLINKGWPSYYRGDFEIALNYYQQALALARSTGLLAREIDATYKIGEVYARWGDVGQANHFIDLALARIKKGENSILRARALAVKAKVLFESGMYQLAKIMYEDSLLAYSDGGDKNEEVNILYQLGRVHINLREFNQAERYFQQVLSHDLKSGNRSDLGETYFILAETALEKGNYFSALNYQKKSLDLLLDVDDQHLKGRLYSQAAIIYFYNNQNKKSEKYFAVASEIQKRLKDIDGQIETGYRRALTYEKLGDKENALRILENIANMIRLRRSNMVRDDLKQSYLALQQK